MADETKKIQQPSTDNNQEKDKNLQTTKLIKLMGEMLPTVQEKDPELAMSFLKLIELLQQNQENNQKNNNKNSHQYHENNPSFQTKPHNFIKEATETIKSFQEAMKNEEFLKDSPQLKSILQKIVDFIADLFGLGGDKKEKTHSQKIEESSKEMQNQNNENLTDLKQINTDIQKSSESSLEENNKIPEESQASPIKISGSNNISTPNVTSSGTGISMEGV